MTALEANNLSIHSPSGKILVSAASCKIEDGKFCALIGPNGAGKSSLLKGLSGELRAKDGSVQLDSCDLLNWETRLLAQRRAVLAQFNPLHFAFTAEQVAGLGRSPHPGSQHQNKALIQYAMQLTDSWAFRDQNYTTLSGGEQQRVQLARVLCQILKSKQQSLKGQYLLLDEPTTGLDVQHQWTLMQHLKMLTRQGLGVLVVSHDFNLVAQFCDELWLMDKGSLCHSGTPEEVLTESNLRQYFNVHAKIHVDNNNRKPWALIHSSINHAQP